MAINERKYRGFRVTRGDATGEQLAILVPTDYRVLHFASAADETTDWNVANPTHPTLYVHSETTPATDYLSIDHNGTTATISAVGGTLTLNGVTNNLLQVGGTTVITLAAATVTFGAADVVIASGQGLNVGSATQVTVSDGDGATNLIPEVQALGVGTAFAGGAIIAATFNATNTRAVSPKIALVKGAAATQVATTAVADNEVIGSIIAYGSDSADFESPVAAIEFVVDDASAPAAGEMGGSLEFYTTADGGETLTLAMTINNAQNIVLNGATTISVSSAGLTLDSVTQMTLQIGAVDILALDDAAIASFAGAADTAGQDLYIETEDGGAASGANNGVAGGLYSLKTGDGSIPAGAGTTGGAGGAMTYTTGVGGAGSATGTGADGGILSLVTGAGGATSGAGTGGAGGNLLLSPGAGGTTAGGTNGRYGYAVVLDGRVIYVGVSATPGTTQGANWIGLEDSTSDPTGTLTNSLAIYTPDGGDSLDFLHADGTTDTLGT